MPVAEGIEGLQYRIFIEKIHADGHKELIGDTGFIQPKLNMSKEELIFALKALDLLPLDFELRKK